MSEKAIPVFKTGKEMRQRLNAAGIGENAPEIRARVADRLRWLGVALDTDANLRGASVISAPFIRVTVRIIPTDEEWMIAIHTADLLREEPKP